MLRHVCWICWIVTLMALVVIFFFPKPCGFIGEGYSRECGCWGVKSIGVLFPEDWGVFGSDEVVCNGIPTTARCYQFNETYMESYELDNRPEKELVACLVTDAAEYEIIIERTPAE